MRLISFYVTPTDVAIVILCAILAYVGNNANGLTLTIVHIVMAIAVLANCLDVVDVDEKEGK
jgi:hypothetical protein